MARLSFRRSFEPVYPRSSSPILAAACAVAAVTALAACGGGGSKPVAEQVVRGTGFAFRAPGGWKVSRRDTTVAASPKPIAPEIVSVGVFRTTKTYRPELFHKAIPEIDRVATSYARRLGGSVTSSSTVTLVGEKVRQYTLEYEKSGTKLRERITFVFEGRTEYYLLCQWKASDKEPAACGRLLATFALR